VSTFSRGRDGGVRDPDARERRRGRVVELLEHPAALGDDPRLGALSKDCDRALRRHDDLGGVRKARSYEIRLTSRSGERRRSIAAAFSESRLVPSSGWSAASTR
jgi:hypothetical protein